MLPVLNNIKEAEQACGGLSKPSKMPGFSYNTPAKYCKTGSKLQKIEGSVCSNCYALKGRYVFPNVQDALERRYQAMMSDFEGWAESMVYLINKRADKHPEFRWHDSGDIQSVTHLAWIVDVARRTPTVKHWLPTREYGIVKEYLELFEEFPENLCVRLSAHMIGGKAPDFGLPTSTVDSGKGYRCPATSPEHRAASKDGGAFCHTCRACWDPNVKNIDYHEH